MTVFEMYETLTEYVSEEAIDLVSAINGWSEQTMEDILFAVTGYRDFEQFIDER